MRYDVIVIGEDRLVARGSPVGGSTERCSAGDRQHLP